MTTPGARMKDARRKQAEEAAKKYEFTPNPPDPTAARIAIYNAYLQGWTDADSHPDTVESDDDIKAANIYAGEKTNMAKELSQKRDIQNDAKLIEALQKIYSETFDSFLAGIAHARKSQAAEIATIDQDSCFAVGSGFKYVPPQDTDISKLLNLTERKLEKLKRLILLTDDSMSGVEMNQLTASQWSEFVKCFPDEGDAVIIKLKTLISECGSWIEDNHEMPGYSELIAKIKESEE